MRGAPNKIRPGIQLSRFSLTGNRPSEALAEFGRAVALLSLGLRDHAIADFRRALELNPCLFDARLNLKKAGEPTPLPPTCRFTPQQLVLYR